MSEVMYPTPLFELSWREGSQTYSIHVELDAALSLFRSLSAAVDFYDAKLERSGWNSYTSKPA